MKKFAKLEQWKLDVKANAAKKLATVEAAKVGTEIRYFPKYSVRSIFGIPESRWT